MDAGLHVFTEKPLALSVAEGQSMVERARATNRVLMVGYMKRYDPAYERLANEMPQLGALRHSRLTTLESPLSPEIRCS